MDAAAIYPNLLRARIAAHQHVLTFRILSSRSTDIIRIAKASGHHAVLIDLQHSSMSLDTCCQMSTAALDLGLTPMVRIAEGMLSSGAVALDGGAQALLLPGVETAEAAAEAIGALRYPPIGRRSVTAALPQAGYRKLPAAELTEGIDRETLIFVQIESRRAVDNAAEIAAVRGVDALVTGTNDLCAEMGLFGQHGHPEIKALHERLLAVCRAQGLPLIAGGIGNLEILQDYLALGTAPHFLTGSDIDLLLEGARTAAQRYGPLIAEAGPGA